MYKTKSRNHKNHSRYDLYADLERIKSAFSDATHDVKGKASELIYQSIENAKDKSTEVRDNFNDYVADRPIKSIGIAVLTGMIIGYFLHK